MMRVVFPEDAPRGPAGGRQEPRALLDLTALPRPQRHRTVLAALEALDPGTRLVIVNDHEPVPLRRQLERRYGERLGWESCGGAPERVAVAIWLEDPGRPSAPVGPVQACAEPSGALEGGRR